ncbi:MAG: CCA tRNA nucleotidyltransferase [Pirellulaceae bacterium]|nr:CCA tRNA nucleotidyltransferase [Pirellulaceae bacterium]
MNDSERPSGQERHPAELVRGFALRVVQKLRDAGFAALWAGGCVRDELLGRVPSDYDVATDARPDQVRACFGHRRTLAIGAAFGVITVLGRRGEGQIEVATFRSDAAYSDGRRPDAVRFSTAEEDALRRDFTVNGLFLDPLTGEVIDYVGGRADLAVRVLRAIGDPYARLAEDKLRMLRAVRFATTLEFTIDPATLAAVQREAAGITAVSAERIAAELRKVLLHPCRVRGVDLLRASRLMEYLLPEALAGGDAAPDSSGVPSSGSAPRSTAESTAAWDQTRRILDALDAPTFSVALAGLLWSVHARFAGASGGMGRICARWRLSNHESRGVQWLLHNEVLLRRARSLPWPQVQRVLIHRRIAELVSLATAVAQTVDGTTDDVDFCRGKLQLPPDVLNPPLLLTGDDLCAAGYAAGPRFAAVLAQVRDAQLEGRVADPAAALALARTLLSQVD